MKKNKIIYAIIASVMLVAPSCQLTEDPASLYDAESFYTTEDNAKLAVVGVYSSLGGSSHYGQYEMAIWATDDQHFVKGNVSDGTRRDISHYMLTSANEWIEPLWVNKYDGLNSANVAIAGIMGMESFENSSTLQQAVGEAKFLRALYSFDLVKMWGDVPYHTSVQSGYGDNLYGERVDRELIYDQIIEDLEDAIEYLPWATASSSPETATQGSARALLMRVCLQRAGYSLQTDGVLTRADDNLRAEMFAKVKEQWEAFQSEGSYHNFFSAGTNNDYEKFFYNNSNASVYSSQESLFEIAFYTVDGSEGVVGLFGSYNGPLTNEADVALTEAWGRANSYIEVVPEWRDVYLNEDSSLNAETDIRRSVSIATYKWSWDSDASAHVYEELAASKGWTPGKWRREWETIGNAKNTNNTDINYCMLRYSDVVLMAAEALYELGDEGSAWSLLNSVRTRAGLTTDVNESNVYESYNTLYNVSEKLSKINTPFKEALFLERGLEFITEGMRRYDLIRWGVLYEAICATYNAIDNSTTSEYISATNFTPGKHELFPIPLSEMNTNHNLFGVNNNGY